MRNEVAKRGNRRFKNGSKNRALTARTYGREIQVGPSGKIQDAGQRKLAHHWISNELDAYSDPSFMNTYYSYKGG